MKTLLQELILVNYFEAEDPRNTLGVQMRIWTTQNKTEVIVRIENQNNKSEKKLWQDGEKRLNNGEVSDRVLQFLQEIEIVKNSKNWTSSASRTGEVQTMDEYEDADKCIYYVFYVHDYLIRLY